MKINNPDYQLLQFMWRITNDMEGVTHNLPPFAMFEDEGMTIEDVAEILVALENHYQRKFDIPYYPECLMDINDYILGRPRTLDKTHKREQQQAKVFTCNPPRPTLWERIKSKLPKLRL